MEHIFRYVLVVLAAALPLGAMIFVGSYFGVFRRKKYSLGWKFALKVFLLCWALVIPLRAAFGIALSGVEDDLIRTDVSSMWGPLVAGVLIGRWYVSRARRSAEGSVQADVDTPK